MRRILSGIAAGTIVVATITGCGGSPSTSSPQQQAAGTPGTAPQKQGGMAAQQGGGRVVTAARAAQGQVKLAFTYNGTVQSKVQVNLAPKASGRLEQLLVDAGAAVKQGDPIAVLERGNLQLGVQQAQANLLAAQAKLAAVNSGGRPEDVASAQAALESATAKYNQTIGGATASDMQAAKSAVDSAKASVASAQAKLDLLKAGATAADLAAAQTAVDTAQANVKSYESKLAQVQGGATAADVSAQQGAVNKAYTDLLKAQDDYETYKNGRAVTGLTSSSQAAEVVATAQQNYNAAVAKLTQMQTPLAADLQKAQSDYDSAKSSLQSATTKLNQLKNGPTTQDVQQAQSTVDSAQATLASAQSKLAQLQAGPTDNDVIIAQAAVTQAQQTFALKQQPYTDADIQGAQASLEVAKVAFATANQALIDATLVAPFDAVVTQTLVAPGAIVSSAMPVATLLSSSNEIVVSIEESRLGQLKPGLPADIRVAAYPGESIPGKVASIAPSADAKSHTFAMKVVPTDPTGKLKAGMYAELKVTADEHPGVLVPRDAATQRNGKDVMFAIADGKVQIRQVVLGLPDGDNVEVVSGIKAGEQVVVVGYSGLNEGDSVRVAGSADQQQSPAGSGGQRGSGGSGAPAKTQ